MMMTVMMRVSLCVQDADPCNDNDDNDDDDSDDDDSDDEGVTVCAGRWPL